VNVRPRPVPPTSHRKAFLSRALVTGATSLTQADALCRSEGGPSFAAFRSPGDGGSITARFLQNDDGGWFRADGYPFLPLDTDLANGFDPALPLVTYADGGYHHGTISTEVQFVHDLVWTGRFGSGADCSGWTSTSGVGVAGIATSITLAWAFADVDCSTPAHVYCLER
jgi:hypothetical protein